MDLLSRLLSLMPVTGRLDVRCHFGAPWLIDKEKSGVREIPYHVLLSGSAVVEDGTGPLERLFPGDIGSAKGLVTDESARVLRAEGSVIEGLYAVGNDMHSIMGGTYPGPGITIGPAITFGYVAGKHAAARAAA